MSIRKYEYDFSVSFADEDRDYAEKLVKLIEKEVIVFYDKRKEVELVGRDLSKELKKNFSKNCKCFLAIVSKYYAKKDWTRFEFEIGLKEAKKRNYEFIIPIRLDSTELVGLPYTTKYLDANKYSLKQIAKILIAKSNNTEDYHKVRTTLLRLITTESIRKFNNYRKSQKYSSLDLSQTNLGGLWKIKKEIRPLNLSGVILKKVNFDQSDLSEMKISNSDLSYCSFYLSTISEGNFNEVDLSHVIMQQADLYDLSIVKCNLFHSVFRIANLFETYFRKCYIYQTDFSYAKCNNSCFIECALYDVNFNNANLAETSFESSLLLNCKQFKGLKCEQANFTNATINSAELVDYLRNNGARNMPDPIFDTNEIRKRLTNLGFSLNQIEEIMNNLK